MKIRQYDSYVNAFLDLEAKRIDAVVVDEIVGRYYISKEKADFEVLEDNPITSQYLSVGLRKTDTESEISTKWFGKDIFIKG